MTLAHDLGIDVRETMITRDQLYVADEVFHPVQDVSKMTAEVEGNLASGVASGEAVMRKG